MYLNELSEFNKNYSEAWQKPPEGSSVFPPMVMIAEWWSVTREFKSDVCFKVKLDEIFNLIVCHLIRLFFSIQTLQGDDGNTGRNHSIDENKTCYVLSTCAIAFIQKKVTLITKNINIYRAEYSLCQLFFLS